MTTTQHARQYANFCGANSDVIDWLNRRVTNQQETEVEHVIDYLCSDERPKRLERMTWEQAVSNADKWSRKMQKRGEHIKESEDDAETVLDFGDGYRFVKLVGKPAFEREGFLMRHCVASYYGSDRTVYSLRDKNNNPHCTIEDGQQIKGKGNGCIHPKYIKYVIEFIESMGIDVSEKDMKNIGYLDVERHKNKLSDNTVKNLFRGKYQYIKNKMIGKDGLPFVDIDVMEVVFDYDEPFLVSTKEYIERLVEIENEKSQKTEVQAEDEIKHASTGHFSRHVSTGDCSQHVSTGYYTWHASIGDYAQHASIGDSDRHVSTGDLARHISTGDWARHASIGYYCKHVSVGKDCVIVAIGDESTIKAKKGTWITLAEYKDGKPVCVKSAMIDGEVLKEDTSYKLRGGEFVEVYF